jgi:hypothetical protein
VSVFARLDCETLVPFYVVTKDVLNRQTGF